MPSITEVAKQAGVSAATVSRTFSTPDLLSHQTRRRVLEVADQLNYRPRRRLVKDAGPGRGGVQSDCLGFLFFASEHDANQINEFYAPVLVGAQAEAALLGMHLIVRTVPRYERPHELPKMFREQAVSGMLLVGAALPDVLDTFAAHMPQTVLVDNRDPAGRYDSVISDGFGGMLEATRTLIGLGHRRIGFVMNEPTAPSFQDRRRGYQAACAEAGLPLNPDWLVCVRPDQPLVPAVEALLTAPDRPTAVVASNDVNAFVVMKAARALGLDIPGDLSLIGFDDIPTSTHTYPPLTTLRVDKSYLGRLAVRQLRQRIQETPVPAGTREPPVQQTIPVTLMPRETCRAIPHPSSSAEKGRTL